MDNAESDFYTISSTGLIESTPSIESALEARQKGAYLWLDFCQPSKEDLQVLIDFLGIHPLSIEDCTDNEQLPKLDNFPAYTFLILNTYELVQEELIIHEVDFFIGKDFVISVADKDSQGQPVLNYKKQLRTFEDGRIQKGPSHFLHQMIDKLVDQKYEQIELLEDNLDKNEDLILGNIKSFKPTSLMETRRNLLMIRRSLLQEREVLGKIARGDSVFISNDALIYFRDIYDHLSIYLDMAETARDLETNLMEMYLSMLNNEMSKAASRTNAIMRRLTIITTIFMPLTLISGIGGMSEYTMITGPENWRIAYLVLLTVMTVIGLVNWLLLRKLERKVEQLD